MKRFVFVFSWSFVLIWNKSRMKSLCNKKKRHIMCFIFGVSVCVDVCFQLNHLEQICFYIIKQCMCLMPFLWPVTDYRYFAIFTCEGNEDTNIVILWLFFHDTTLFRSCKRAHNMNDLLQLQKNTFSDTNMT